MKVSSVAAMRAMDRTAIDEFGIPEAILMENAGLAAFRVLAQQWPSPGKCWLVLCGAGNNGGDGLVVARHLHSAGSRVTVLVLGDPARYGAASAANLYMVQRLGIGCRFIDDAAPVVESLAVCDGVVDGLLGTGITRPVDGLYAAAIEAVNAAGKPVLALDIPSGVNGDTGQVMGVAIRADHTVTFGLPKSGNLLYPGYEHGGRLWVSHISFPPALVESAELTTATNDPLALPPRPADGHKGSFGDVLVVAGARAYYGAPYFAALSVMAAGGGYVRLAAPRGVVPVIASRASEIVYVPQAETAGGNLALDNLPGLIELAAERDFVIAGPGTSLDGETQELLRRLAAETPTPLLLDGDGLTAVVGHPDILRNRRGPTVLTPHLGELARLTGLSTDAIRNDRLGVLRQTAADLHATIVMKGAHTLIGYPDGRVYVNLSGNAGMATAGSGDVLTGTIAAMSGLGQRFDDAVRMGVFVHGLAGDLAAESVGQDGMTAQTILEHLPLALRLCRERDDSWLRRYFLPVV
jgi:NAD(P)H-hydrate epimerase